MLLGITAYLFLSVAMWSCVYMRIDGYLYDEPPYMWPNSALVSRIRSNIRRLVYTLWWSG
jgi:hypothetical protein